MIEDKNISREITRIRLDPILSGQILIKEESFAIDLSTLQIPQMPIPLEYDHKTIIGNVIDARVQDGKLIGTGEIISYTESDLAGDLSRRLKDKENEYFGLSPRLGLANAIKYCVPSGDSQIVNGLAMVGPFTIYQFAELESVSITPYPTDRKSDLSALFSNSANNITLSKEKDLKMEEEEKKEPTEEVGSGQDQNPYTAHPDLEELISEIGSIEKAVDYFRRGTDLDTAQKEHYAELKKMCAEIEASKKKELSEEPEKEPDPIPEEEDKTDPEEKKELSRLAKSNQDLEEKILNLSREMAQLKKRSFGEREPVSNSDPKIIGSPRERQIAEIREKMGFKE